MNEEKLEQELRDCFQSQTETIEPTLNWWDKTISNVIGQNKQPRRFGFTPRRRLAWALIPLVGLLIGGTVYAASPAMHDVLGRFFGHIENSGLAQDMDLSQTINGVTVRLERAYADSNVVLLGCTVSGPGDNYNLPDLRLSTTDGQNLPFNYAVGISRVKEIMGNWDPSERSVVLGVFDASVISGTTGSINLKLTLPVQQMTYLTTTLPSQSAVTGTDTESTGLSASGPVLEITENSPDVILVGEVTFDFTIPVHKGKVVDVNQTVTAAGIPVTLAKVVISPFETRAVFSYAQTDSTGYINGRISMVLPSGKSVDADGSFDLDGVHRASFTDNYTGIHGAATLTLNEMLRKTPAGADGSSGIERLEGPWVFHFNLP
jgi:hypothetical protein